MNIMFIKNFFLTFFLTYVYNVERYNAKFKYWTFMGAVIIKTDSVIFCGSTTIVSDYWAFTTTHVSRYLINQSLIEDKLTFIRSNSSSWKAKGNKYYIDHLIVFKQDYPEDVLPNLFYPDMNFLSILKVDKPFSGKFEKSLPVDSSYAWKEPANIKKPVRSAGWGSLRNNKPYTYLAKGLLPLNRSNECAFKRLTPYSLCLERVATDVCFYDNGSPIVYKRILIAIISIARIEKKTNRFCIANRVDYLKVSPYFHWLWSVQQEYNINFKIKYVKSNL